VNIIYGAAGALVLLVLSFGAGWHFGGESGKLAESKAVAKQEAQVITQTATDTSTINTEAKAYAAAQIDPVAAPVVSLCHYTPAAAVLGAAAAGSGPHVAPHVPAPGPPAALPGPDIGRPLVQVGHDADAQVAGLQDYIEHVCRVKAP
jgi:hypothetical protein